MHLAPPPHPTPTSQANNIVTACLRGGRIFEFTNEEQFIRSKNSSQRKKRILNYLSFSLMLPVMHRHANAAANEKGRAKKLTGTVYVCVGVDKKHLL